MVNKDSQRDVFIAGEGDQWFARNAGKVGAQRPELEVFRKYVKPGSRVLEIGCSAGYHAPLFTGMGARYFGLDPSKKAIEQARKDFPGSTFTTGTSESLPFEESSFDFVFFGFCLYLVDRAHLARTVAEADRVLAATGYLAILDFETKPPSQRSYAHAAGVSSYKMDYGSLFLAFPHYAGCYKAVFGHGGADPLAFEEQIQERVSVSVLYKNLAHGYLAQ